MGASLIDCVKRAENMAAGCKDAIAYVQPTAQKYRDEAKLIFERIEQASVMTAEVRSVCDDVRKEDRAPGAISLICATVHNYLNTAAPGCRRRDHSGRAVREMIGIPFILTLPPHRRAQGVFDLSHVLLMGHHA